MLRCSFSVDSTDQQWEVQAASGAAEWQRLETTWQVAQCSALCAVSTRRRDVR